MPACDRCGVALPLGTRCKRCGGGVSPRGTPALGRYTYAHPDTRTPTAPSPAYFNHPRPATERRAGWTIDTGSLAALGIAIFAITLSIALVVRGRDEAPAPAPTVSIALDELPPRANDTALSAAYVSRGSPERCGDETTLHRLQSWYAGVDARSRREATLSVQEERALGREVLKQLPDAIGGTLTEQGRDVDYVKAVAEPLLRHLNEKPSDWTFHILNEVEFPNAIALPGKHVVVTQPLLSSWVENEAQLAAVLGHEIAHGHLRHPVASEEAVRAARRAGADEAAAQLARVLASTHGTIAEEEADTLGLRLAHQVGYDLGAIIQLWEKGLELGDPESEHDPFALSLSTKIGHVLQETFRSHPDPEVRACQVLRAAIALQDQAPREKGYVGTQNYKNREAFRVRSW